MGSDRTAATPLLVFDEVCAFCTTWVERLREYLPAFPIAAPTYSWIAAIGDAFIARSRHRLPGGTPACALPRPDAP